MLVQVPLGGRLDARRVEPLGEGGEGAHHGEAGLVRVAQELELENAREEAVGEDVEARPRREPHRRAARDDPGRASPSPRRGEHRDPDGQAGGHGQRLVEDGHGEQGAGERRASGAGPEEGERHAQRREEHHQRVGQRQGPPDLERGRVEEQGGQRGHRGRRRAQGHVVHDDAREPRRGEGDEAVGEQAVQRQPRRSEREGVERRLVVEEVAVGELAPQDHPGLEDVEALVEVVVDAREERRQGSDEEGGEDPAGRALPESGHRGAIASR